MKSANIFFTIWKFYPFFLAAKFSSIFKKTLAINMSFFVFVKKNRRTIDHFDIGKKGGRYFASIIKFLIAKWPAWKTCNVYKK